MSGVSNIKLADDSALMLKITIINIKEGGSLHLEA